MGDPMLEMGLHTIVAFPVRLNSAFALAAAHQELRSDRQRFGDTGFLPYIPAPYVAFICQYHLFPPLYLPLPLRIYAISFIHIPITCTQTVRSVTATQARARGSSLTPPPPLTAPNRCTVGERHRRHSVTSVTVVTCVTASGLAAPLPCREGEGYTREMTRWL